MFDIAHMFDIACLLSMKQQQTYVRCLYDCLCVYGVLTTDIQDCPCIQLSKCVPFEFEQQLHQCMAFLQQTTDSNAERYEIMRLDISRTEQRSEIRDAANGRYDGSVVPHLIECGW